MFNTILPYRLVQRNRNHTLGRASWVWAAIYKFFMHTPTNGVAANQLLKKQISARYENIFREVF